MLSTVGTHRKNTSKDSKHEERSSQEESQNEVVGERVTEQFPDGGLRAWVVVIGAACSSYATFGFVNSWGVFQAYYEQTLLQSQTPSAISWIGSIQYSLVFFPGLVVGRLFDLGYFRALFVTSGLLLVVATFLAAQCTEYWQFLLSQGIMAGIGCGGLFTCNNSVIAHWFKEKRGSALGYMAIGSALAGTTIPIIVKNLLPIAGFRWTMRILGFIFLFVVSVCNVTMNTRLPPINVKGGLFNFAVFRNVPYTLYTLSIFISYFGVYTIMIYISVSATRIGTITPELVFYFVAIVNATSLFGRWSAGVLADVIGPLNIMSPATFIIGATTYAWPFARSTAPLVIISIIYGFTCGAFVSLLPKPVMNLGDEGDIGRRVGMFLTVIAFGALAGPPISGAINKRTNGFEIVGTFAGSMLMVGFALMLICRFAVLGRFIGKV
ncbi:hypothetical protein Ac2012v2_002213 [Leucoagaricus gongylophorus]